MKSSPEQYVDLSKSQMYLKCKLAYMDGKDVPPEDRCAPVNNLSGSLFSTGELFLNDTCISSRFQ